MNKWEREVQASLFSSEEDALKALEQEYKRTLQSIMDQVKLFDADIKMLDDAIVDAGGTDDALLTQRQSKVYQRQFQNNLKAQIEAILDKLHSDEYGTINDYLNGCYKDAFVGSEYALAMQGVPVITPVRPEAVTKAVLLDSKVVKGYYARIGIDINKLKPKIASEITRGIASAMSYADIARNLDAVSGSGLYNAKRIVRTEGHRIQQAAWMDSAEDAKAHGADLVRIWSSTLDGRTRETHRMYDGETAEVGGKFRLNGRDVDAPGYFGIPSEDCNCRCVALSRPKWALNDPVRKNDGFNGKIREFDTPDDYEDFKEKYWGKDNTNYMDYLSQLEQKYGTKDYQTLLGKLSNKEYAKLNRLENDSPLWNVASDATKKREKSTIVDSKKERTTLSIDGYHGAFVKGAEKKNTQALVDYVNGLDVDSNGDALWLYSRLGDLEQQYDALGIDFKVSHANGHAIKYVYKNSTKGFTEVTYCVPKLSGDILDGQVHTTLHEQMHLLDLMLKDDPGKYGKQFSYAREELRDAIKGSSPQIGDQIKDLFGKHDKEHKRLYDSLHKAYSDFVDDLRKRYIPNGVFGAGSDYKTYKKLADKAYKDFEAKLDYESRNIFGGGIGNLEDIYDALFGGSLRDSGGVLYGHGRKYYSDQESRCSEIVANFGNLSVLRPDLVDMLEKDKPELVKALRENLTEMRKKAETIVK